ncbi:MAG: ATP-binding protein [Deltaproteobacteria bacterium]|nr:ATP-binding protein [Deltaproteobacteria bacterium]
MLRQLCVLLHALSHESVGAVSRERLLRDISNIIIGFSGSETVEWWIGKEAGNLRLELNRSGEQVHSWQRTDSAMPEPAIVSVIEDGRLSIRSLPRDSEYRSLLALPLVSNGAPIGVVQLKSREIGSFSQQQADFYNLLVEILLVALSNQKVEFELRERVKELSCLYQIVGIGERPDASLVEILTSVADILPAAWQHSDVASARVVFEGRSYGAADVDRAVQVQSADLVVKGVKQGVIQVAYREERPAADEGPFLKEERNLIDAVATKAAGIVERCQARDEKALLEEQLRHADRLATIGQFAAGIAHELNEPLGNILGFAQLAEKIDGLPGIARSDLRKIVNAAMYTREIVSKLKIFARQMPSNRIEVDLNALIEEGLTFVEWRCTKQGVRIVEDLEAGLPRIRADQGQLYQVLVNLTVNAAQAMPAGGVLTIRTRGRGDGVALIVEDTGIGMTEDVRKKIFLPFFTTKGIDQGTGLGLSVVHGIVTSHGGSIEVRSQPGRGSVFEIALPWGGEAGGQDG